jgi:hypothetical protein
MSSMIANKRNMKRSNGNVTIVVILTKMLLQFASIVNMLKSPEVQMITQFDNYVKLHRHASVCLPIRFHNCILRFIPIVCRRFN